MVPGARADDGGDRAQGRAGAARPARRRQGRPAAVPLVDVRASGLARRAARDGAAEGGRADRRDRRHQFRRRASGAGAGRRRAGRHQPGFVLAGRPPRRRRRCPQLCREKGVKLLAYGTLCGGFLSDKWLGQPEPTDDRRLEPLEIQALHRRGRRLGRRSRASCAAAGDDRQQARRLDLQRRDALGAGA